MTIETAPSTTARSPRFTSEALWLPVAGMVPASAAPLEADALVGDTALVGAAPAEEGGTGVVVVEVAGVVLVGGAAVVVVVATVVVVVAGIVVVVAAMVVVVVVAGSKVTEIEPGPRPSVGSPGAINTNNVVEPRVKKLSAVPTLVFSQTSRVVGL
jgi:hypothetical protein